MDREKIISALNKVLDEEMEKSPEKWDIEKIDELTAAINELKGHEAANEPAQDFTETVISETESRTRAKKRGVIKRFSAAAACFAVMFFGANVASHRVLGQGVLPAGYSAVMGGIHTFLDGGDGSPDPHENIYFDTMKEKIDEYGLDVMIPTYIPKGFELEKTECDSICVRFFFTKGNYGNTERMIVTYYDYPDDYVGSYGIPTDTREMYETHVNGHLFYTIREDQQLKAWCIEGKTITQICTYNTSYQLADGVLYSFEEL